MTLLGALQEERNGTACAVINQRRLGCFENASNVVDSRQISLKASRMLQILDPLILIQNLLSIIQPVMRKQVIIKEFA